MASNGTQQLCPCGQNHHPRSCFHLNPSMRPRGWVVSRAMIATINSKLLINTILRNRILALGYEHYPNAKTNPQVTTKTSLHRNLPHRIAKSPATGVSNDPTLRLAGLPVEIITKIFKLNYQMIVDELPGSHPLLHAGSLTTSRMQYKNPQNKTPPPDLNNRDRKGWLWHHPGKWARVFQVMFVSKQFYAIAKPIRYREIHIDACFLPVSPNAPLISDRTLLLRRMSMIRSFFKDTRHINLKIMEFGRTEENVRLIKALKSLPKLRHLCLTLGGGNAIGSTFPTPGDQSSLLFFDQLSQLETLTIIWGWKGDQRLVSQQSDDEEDSAMAARRTKAECHMQHCRARWMTDVYEKSSWYLGDKQNAPLIKGKAKHTHDWTATRGSHHILQWDVDCFAFKKITSPRPDWNLWENPHNHPDQLYKHELSSVRPVRLWRKGYATFEDPDNDKDYRD